MLQPMAVANVKAKVPLLPASAHAISSLGRSRRRPGACRDTMNDVIVFMRRQSGHLHGTDRAFDQLDTLACGTCRCAAFGCGMATATVWRSRSDLGCVPAHRVCRVRPWHHTSGE